MKKPITRSDGGYLLREIPTETRNGTIALERVSESVNAPQFILPRFKQLD